MTPDGLRPIRCQACGKLICEADGTVLFRCPRCKRRNVAEPGCSHSRVTPGSAVPPGSGYAVETIEAW